MAGGNKKIHEHPKAGIEGFQKNPQNIGKGRPKKIYTILKEQGYSKDDTNTVFSELLYYTFEDLKKVEDDPTKPAIVKLTAKILRLAYEKGDFNKAKEILEHSIGRPQQNIKTENQQSVEINTQNIEEFIKNITN